MDLLVSVNNTAGLASSSGHSMAGRMTCDVFPPNALNTGRCLRRTSAGFVRVCVLGVCYVVAK